MSTPAFTCINGTFLPANAAAMPVSDRLVRFGDGIFETIRFEGGVPYQWEAHMARMDAGLASLRITPPIVDWQATSRAMMMRNAMENGYLRIAISRGIGSRGYMPDEAMRANWIMECLPPAPLPAAPYKLHVASITRPPLSALPVNQKLAHGIGSTLALLEARDHHCDEAILLTVDGKLCEAAAANLFWIANGKIYTPALETGCLAGTTRAAIMRLAPVQETVADVGALHHADALFLTNARVGVWPANCAKFKILDSQQHDFIAQLMQSLIADRIAAVDAARAAWVSA